MNLITNDISKAVRRKRADLCLSKKDVCEEINISFKTYYKIEIGGLEVKNNVYQKITQWLAKDY
ncbi:MULTISPECIES: hypothetical protein [unclassified Lactococcus]|uniref:hypothetical protein n=1 Tax=unclassified Lactococcus TaxID=2643510 RepID=UPI0011C9A8D6|nr:MULTISPECIES: hypothetical protein [unclassified Lactococcus]MQW23947.1 hypothetical protein [Lactococcus sp. dk101]TXK36990.1 hypothetical protein FVP42_10265 [Lactococcus sp. dk310]TXK47615.1 hypothetical protein FVP43_09970 [Lactococcus sp. dk322]